jgi:DHA2 family multidrug resistance protein-like MFS transporter
MPDQRLYRACGTYGPYLAAATYWLFAVALIAAAPAMALGLGLSGQSTNTAVGLAALLCGMLIWPARKAAVQLGPAGPSHLAQAGMVVFIAGAVLAAAAPDSAALLIGRALQGVSGAMVLPYAMPYAMAYTAPYGIAYGIAYAVPAAALLGGVLTSALDWQWVFWLSLPVAAAALAAITLAPPEEHDTAPAERVANEHYTPLALLIPGLLAAYTVVNQASAWEWSAARTLILIVVAVFALALFVRWEREHADDPQLDLSPSPVAAFLLHFAVIAALYVLLTYLQAPAAAHGRGLPAVTAALFTLALAAGATAARFLPFPPMAGAVLAAIGLTLTACTGLGPGAYYPLTLIGVALAGAGLAPVADTHPAAGQLGAAAGIAVTGAITSGILDPNPTTLGRATATALLVSAAVAATSVFVAAGNRAE